jgi:TRAP-type C4-dicarboxylate transport system substrate-binding protein
MAQELEQATHGTVKMKWYFGGIAGDETAALDRIRKGQLDGAALSLGCMKIAPSLRVQRLVGLFQSRGEAVYIVDLMRPTVIEEAQRAGMVALALGAFGTDILFTREPVHKLAELRKLRLWIWSLDPVVGPELEAMGMKPVPTALDEAGRAYDDGRIDGFVGVPTAALAFQWSTRVRYFTDLRFAFVSACLAISQKAFDPLSSQEKESLRHAGANLERRFDAIGRTQDDALLGGLFQKQGLQSVPPSRELTTAFFEAARRTRERLGDQGVPRELFLRVESWLADYRAEHSR